MTAVIRDARPDDLPTIGRLYATAFPEEDLAGLVVQLLDHPSRCLSLLAVGADGAILGHVHHTFCAVADWDGAVVLLGPLAVSPDHQRSGIGRRLVAAAHLRLAEAGGAHVLVLGDPGYYARFGFAPETAISPPYALPQAWATAWQGLSVGAQPTPPPGPLQVPDPWQDPALWLP